MLLPEGTSPYLDTRHQLLGLPAVMHQPRIRAQPHPQRQRASVPAPATPGR